MSTGKQCDACGQANAIEAAYCVRCGSSVFTVTGPSPQRAQPDPPTYPSVTEGVRDDWYASRPPDPPAVQYPAPAASHFQCPFCRSTAQPRVQRRISNAGVVTMILLAVFCFPLFWIGFLIKEDYRVCSSCGIALG
jgi:hypothetical protein